MSAEEMRALDKRMKAWDQHDIDGFVNLFDDNAVWVDVGMPEPMKSKDMFRMYMQTWFTAFPDMRSRTTNLVVSDSDAAAELVFEGTHTGPLQGPPGTQAIPATGKKITGKGTYFLKAKNGKIVEFHSYPDMAGALMQLGVLGG